MKDIPVLPYHAGLMEGERTRNQEAFIRDDVNIIVATIAFGMGINKPDVRFVVHHDMPQNIESYYQQIGRAGRDGLKADCMLLYSYSDKQKIQYFINQKEGTEKEVAEKHLDALFNYLDYGKCRRKPLMNYFGESYEKKDCGMCDNCLRQKDDLTGFYSTGSKIS
jgi:ATP-dependent DNA helicase RecQ